MGRKGTHQLADGYKTEGFVSAGASIVERRAVSFPSVHSYAEALECMARRRSKIRLWAYFCLERRSVIRSLGVGGLYRFSSTYPHIRFAFVMILLMQSRSEA